MSPLGSLERALRVAVAVLAIAVALLANVRAHASERWIRAAEVSEVAVTVLQVSELELKAARAKYGYRDARSLGNVVQWRRHGFSVLLRNPETGAYRCEVYLRDAGDSATLEHELRHCNGWAHP